MKDWYFSVVSSTTILSDCTVDSKLGCIYAPKTYRCSLSNLGTWFHLQNFDLLLFNADSWAWPVILIRRELLFVFICYFVHNNTLDWGSRSIRLSTIIIMGDHAFILLQCECSTNLEISVFLLVLFSLLIARPGSSVFLETVTDILNGRNSLGQGLEERHYDKVNESWLRACNFRSVSIAKERYWQLFKLRLLSLLEELVKEKVSPCFGDFKANGLDGGERSPACWIMSRICCWDSKIELSSVLSKNSSTLSSS